MGTGENPGWTSIIFHPLHKLVNLSAAFLESPRYIHSLLPPLLGWELGEYREDGLQIHIELHSQFWGQG